eukprot:6048671-Pleurochrysis_carterae.AAC.1
MRPLNGTSQQRHCMAPAYMRAISIATIQKNYNCLTAAWGHPLMYFWGVDSLHYSAKRLQPGLTAYLT